MPWLQITFECEKSHTEALEDALLTIGASAVTLRDAADQPVLEPGVGETPLWTEVKLTALFDAQVDTDRVLLELITLLPFDLPSLRIEILEDRDWERSWMDHYQPMLFGERLWICPSWQQPPQSDAVNLLLDPGLAFGTGTHPTTSLCLQWLDSWNLKGQTVVDYGCGSGVLAVAAILLGASHVVAVDNDPQALDATLENARRNYCADKIQVQTPEQALERKIAPVDVVLANILAKPLMELAPRLTELVVAGGQLLLSGLLIEQAEAVKQAYTADVVFDGLAEQDGWVRLHGCRAC